MNASLKFGDVVALLVDAPEKALARGQVGTVVELLENQSSFVEFSDDQGRTYAIAAFLSSKLSVLQDT